MFVSKSKYAAAQRAITLLAGQLSDAREAIADKDVELRRLTFDRNHHDCPETLGLRRNLADVQRHAGALEARVDEQRTQLDHYAREVERLNNIVMRSQP